MTRKQLEEVEFLCGQIIRLAEARAMASAASSSLLRNVGQLHRQMVTRLEQLVRAVLGHAKMSGADQPVPPRYPLELLERMFASLRAAAEVMQAKASWAKGTERRRMAEDAMRLADLTRAAAESLRLAAEDRGVWTASYIQEHGLGPWV